MFISMFMLMFWFDLKTSSEYCKTFCEVTWSFDSEEVSVFKQV